MGISISHLAGAVPESAQSIAPTRNAVPAGKDSLGEGLRRAWFNRGSSLTIFSLRKQRVICILRLGTKVLLILIRPSRSNKDCIRVPRMCIGDVNDTRLWFYLKVARSETVIAQSRGILPKFTVSGFGC